MKSTQKAILNISHGLVNKSINVLYHYHKSLFDIIFKTLDINIFNYDGVHSYYYDVFISNNFLHHHNSTGEYSKNYHIKDLLLFHSPPPAAFKKEDIQLAYQNTAHTHTIFFGQYLADSWRRTSLPYTKIIEYGIPDLSTTSERTKNILLFNFDNNPNTSLLHQHINKYLGGCDMLQDIPGNVSIQDIAGLLSQYRVCIDTTSIINSLLAASCGCYCITSLVMDNNPLLIHITDYNDIISIIKNLLASTISEQDRQYNAKQLINKYDYNTFKNEMLNIINHIKYKEIFWL